ncbi:MAG: tetratricopeptide repeat protein, partial [Chitinophagaceae bacterium]
MKKNSLLLVFLLLAGSFVYAQVEQGEKYYYYQRYQSAEDAFRKVLATEPDNEAANYWLGQVMIAKDDSASAKVLYQQQLAKNSKAPFILVGMGEIDLMDNKITEARQKFETAISLTKGRDVNVFNAIARANIDAGPGDAKYAIEKINAIPQRRRKDQKNAESYLLLGRANRKLINGGDAVQAFKQALSMEPKLAAAKYEIGKVYLTQNNPEFFLPAFEEAVALDPAYAPAFNELFFYWFKKDINKAREYFDKYLAVSDRDISSQYDKTSIIYASRDFQTAIDSSKLKIDRLKDKADPRYYKLVAYSYDELKDSVNAKNYLEQYFAKQKQADFLPQDYVFRGKLLGKFPGNETEAMNAYEKAVELDTSKAGKLEIMRAAADIATSTKNYDMQAEWLGRIYKNTPEPTNRDLFDLGFANYQAKKFETADSIFCGVYTVKYPEEIFGYMWCARAAAARDTSMEKGTAVEPYKKLISFGRSSGERE